ncbi:amidohydrolase family protein [Mesorhizobium sp. Cs1299R1N1]|uniref:amidohydrolase family protein n=1 Tax=Mesorhizobium sp. Cs1299R1N1 TaxID=3015172 RepID=UPI00301DA4D6
MLRQIVDTLVFNGDVFTGDKAQSHHQPGAIAIKDGVIVALGPEPEVMSMYDARRRIDARGGLVHPGFIDTHLHITAMPYHGTPFSKSLDGAGKRRPDYSRMKAATTAEATSAYAAAAACSLLQRGYTLFFEAGTVFETDAFADSITKCGIRAMVSAPFGWDDLSGFEKSYPHLVNEMLVRRAPVDARRVIEQCKYEIERNKNPEALVQGYVCLYGEGSATDDLTQEAAKLARDSNVIFYQHQSFHPDGVRAEKKNYGDAGAVRLERLGVLGTSTTLAHMNVLDEAEIELILSRKPGIVWCPNAALAFRVISQSKCWLPFLHRNGACISLGVDTIATDPIGISGVLSLYLSASLGDNLEDSDPFYMQTINAARNLGISDKVGSLTVGKRADVVIRELRDITHTSWLDDDGILLALSSSMIPVDTVLIDGKSVMEKGQLISVDQNDIVAEARRQREILLKRVYG